MLKLNQGHTVVLEGVAAGDGRNFLGDGVGNFFVVGWQKNLGGGMAKYFWGGVAKNILRVGGQCFWVGWQNLFILPKMFCHPSPKNIFAILPPKMLLYHHSILFLHPTPSPNLPLYPKMFCYPTPSQIFLPPHPQNILPVQPPTATPQPQQFYPWLVQFQHLCMTFLYLKSARKSIKIGSNFQT